MVEYFDMKKHRTLIEAWIRARKMFEPSRFWDVASPLGFVADGIVVAFLYTPPGPLAFAENMVSDPKSEPHVRDKAIHRAIFSLRREARMRGYKALAATPSVPSLFPRMVEQGFTLQHGCAYAIGGL